MVNGFGVGCAFGFVEGCDLAFAANELTFGPPAINVGMIPGGCVPNALTVIMQGRDVLSMRCRLIPLVAAWPEQVSGHVIEAKDEPGLQDYESVTR